jgi:hypothetical protein
MDPSLPPRHPHPMPPTEEQRGTAAIGVGDLFDWQAIFPRLVNPAKVLVIEAIGWIGRPLSATELMMVFDEKKLNLARLSYYLKTLVKDGVLEKVGERKVRGTTERFYFFAPQEQTDTAVPDPT